MTRLRKLGGALGAAALVAGALVSTGPASAAPGDAEARSLDVTLSAEVLGLPVVTATVNGGSVTAPPGGGTATAGPLVIGAPGALGVTASGSITGLEASRHPGLSSATTTINALQLGILGLEVLDATDLTAAVTCPAVGAQTATTQLTSVSLLGVPVALPANTPAVTASAAVTVAGVVGASLDASLSRIEETTADTAHAAVIHLEVQLSGTVLGLPVVIPVGTVTVASASCERAPIPPAPTAAAVVPDSGPAAGGTPVTITGTDFVAGDTTVTFDGVPATDVVVVPDGSSLTAVTPPGSPGPADVVVTTIGGSSPPLAYTYVADGSGTTVTGLDPDHGPTAGARW